MLPIKRGVSAFSKASSSRSALTSSSTITRRFYAQDRNSNGNGANNINADIKVLEELLETARRPPVPDQPPRAPTSTVNVRLPPSDRVRPAPPVGGIPTPTKAARTPRLELPERTAQDTSELPYNDADLDLADFDPSTIVPPDDASKKAASAFGRSEDGREDRGERSPVLDAVTYRLFATARSKNCIMTLTVGEDHKKLAKTSSGLCKFKNAAEGSYEAGYQCAMRMLEKLREEIKNKPVLSVKVEIYLNGFGQGRAALLKALTMSEGEGVRQYVSKLVDTTPIKVGGVRLQKSRRL